MRRLALLSLVLTLAACDTAVPPQPVNEGSGGASVFFLAEDGVEVGAILVPPLGALAVGDTLDGGFSLLVVGEDVDRTGTFELRCLDQEGGGTLVARFTLESGESIDLRGQCALAQGPQPSAPAEWVWTDGTVIIGQGTFSRGEMVP